MSSPSVYAKHSVVPESVIFSIFSSEELKKLCTTKIHTSLTFDAMGQPLPGGLYDRTMGPLSEKSLPCATCNKNVTNCPGHLGYVELPVPIVNPLFHSTVATIVKLSCPNCFKMSIPDCTKKLISLYMKLLDHGMVTEAKEVEDIFKEFIVENKFPKEMPLETAKRIEKLESAVNPICNTGGSNFIFINRTTESFRNKFLRELLIIINVRRCLHCKGNMPKIKYNSRKIIVKTQQTHVSSERGSASRNSLDDTYMSLKAADISIMMPEESREILRKTWMNDSELLIELVPVLKRIKSQFPTDIFYFDIIPVVPPVCRPVNLLPGGLIEHPQTQIYKSILQECMVIRTIISVIQGKSIDTLPQESQTVYELSKGTSATEKLHHLWQSLQIHVDCIMDGELNPIGNDSLGLKQIIGKKDGIIRKHIMGKRVNFAARSVVTPDPNLNIDEIGVPEEFAKHLTYPVPVTPWNVQELRKMVLNGPNVHPGAKLIEFSDGKVCKIGTNKTQQESISKRLLTPGDQGFKGPNIVHRHLINGDILLLNRQPTLHRSSIMAHTARILKDEKTIRLHYANCKAYNVDFDGDEMNMHFPQSEVARSEGYNLVNVSNHYLDPKDGTPLSGLIQDHMMSGVRLSVRGKFFNRYDYHQLVYSAISYKTGHIVLLPPAILKPEFLWSGKQVLSTVIINIIPKNKEPLNLTATAKISAEAWTNRAPRTWQAGGTPFKSHNEMTEAEVIIRQGELLSGILDKTHCGATSYGLIHCVYELYGSQYATKLLSSLAKLLTSFLQQQGFTLGVRDILLQEKVEKKRKEIIKECRKIGHTASALAVDMPPETPEKILLEKLEIASAKNPKFGTIIDRQYKQSLVLFTNEINKTCLPVGLVSKFPANNLQLMIQSGAKGSTVNTMQISCLLGQVELEGKRPPVMISGKSLPSFVAFDPQPRARGFIDSRFMTGLPPQEFFFHCMAGREGLIDTAVKTSRSGYLQRCLVKQLEGLRVCYDLTVRDSDQSVVQYLYGEDGMDSTKVQFLKKDQLQFLAENRNAIVDEDIIKHLKQVEGYSDMKKHITKSKTWKSKNGDPLRRRRTSAFLKFSETNTRQIKLEKINTVNPATGRTFASEQYIDLWQKVAPQTRASFDKEVARCPNPVNAEFAPDHFYGSVTDYIDKLLDEYSSENNGDIKLADTLKLKAMQSLAAPGESVGVLAAQSIGEPSTQMTLNTFHFAGRDEMNVTLGIPRLREILLTASANIKKPSMEIPFRRVPNVEEKAELLCKDLARVTVANVLEKIDVRVRLVTSPIRQHMYTLRFHFLPEELYQNQCNLTPRKILKHMTSTFFGDLFSNISKTAKMSGHMSLVNEVPDKKKNDEEDDNMSELPSVGHIDGSSEEEPEGDQEDAKLNYKYKSKLESQEPEEDEREKSDDEDSENEERGDVDLSDETEVDDSVVQNYSLAQKYLYDMNRNLWCELTFSLPVDLISMDLTVLLKDTANKSFVSKVENIKRGITYMKDDKDLTLKTDGINIAAMFKYVDLLELNRLYSNDIHKIAQTYGIEAARRVIVKEVKNVFNVYGITIDPRHLLLIADYMTYNGSFEPLTRTGMENNVSPLHQMSFESSFTFLKNACVKGKEDSLASPSSCQMIGKPSNTGTGACSLLQKLPRVFI